ncbi:helix-hairpin-helix domain-containing protein [Fictibacillus barbaricus]|uniref:Helix-hairpin-helix domain-containing protein n=1 Tax=Fictibacillus barbaricus TaxID=182136 RepID=A0ABS2ZJQ0_9BACL|nr:helix-hairpin-helix domain-containing protein [Fictibacillus barbaricus]MBN3547569.1 helix-hairpin-helix domain-containing protein [Fictibacillus barbaricus]GGB49914.1 competence protein CelA [Fictibacillus barbaricus]
MEKIKQHLTWFIGAGCILFLLISLSLFNYFKSESNMPITSQIPIQDQPEIKSSDTEGDKNQRQITNEKNIIMIDVQGSVKKPGVYQMKSGDRVIHAIQKAGGFLEEAEIRSVNQALKISDEMVIYVASKGEEYENQEGGSNSDHPVSEKININSADQSILQTLNGVGPAKAESIIAYREEHGPFSSLDQLLEVKGIGEKTIEEWKDKISFE